MNSELVGQAARALASDLLASAAEDADRIRRLYLRALGREPKPAELALTRAFLDRFACGLASSEPDARERLLLAWQSLCQTIMASNEFIYIN
jgi:hypothetical protein